ncbi:MAG: hypothetical protein PVG07_03295 [Acidobacteriota bacterium]
MRTPASLLPAVALSLAALVVTAPRRGAAYSDGPPPGHTGGFGEPTCAACHLGTGEPAGGRLRIEGLPAGYRPGGRYRLKVILEDPGLERAGFQLSVRTVTGAQAGSLEATGERTEVVTGEDGTIAYARQTSSGVEPVASHRAEWSLIWTAPEVPAASGGPGPPPEIRFHAAANAANYDDSELGDTPYALEATLGATEPAD